MSDLTQREQHFEFGANWAHFARGVDNDRIARAKDSLRRLVGDDLDNQSFLDIGCGSGLSALAAILLGAATVRALDLDENAVMTTQTLLAQHASGASWSVELGSVFDLDQQRDGLYDVVYSWGVLHHTGNMARAIKQAAMLVRPGGRFVFAIYQRTPCCNFWRWEKRIYSRAPTWVAFIIRSLYKTAFFAALMAFGRNPVRYVAEYGRNRGMRWSNDVHDWLGGYPYESASAEEIDALVMAFGFSREKAVLVPKSRGILGSGCNEFVYRRTENA